MEVYLPPTLPADCANSVGITGPVSYAKNDIIFKYVHKPTEVAVKCKIRSPK